MTGFGVGWVNSAADYSRYLPRTASTRGVVGWPTLGGSLPVVILVAYGVLLCASDDKLSQAVAADPIGALTTILPTWFLVPFALVAIGGLVSGAVLDIYSSGLTLLTLGLRTPRWMAAAVDGVLMVLGTIYIVWVADSFLARLHGLPDHPRRADGRLVRHLPAPTCSCAAALRRARAVRRAAARLRPGPLGVGAAAARSPPWSAGGWSSTPPAPARAWTGWAPARPLGLGGRDGGWAYANLGVPVALVSASSATCSPGGATRQEAAQPLAEDSRLTHLAPGIGRRR